MQRTASAAIWIATAAIAFTPLLIIASVSNPRPDSDALVVQLAAGALPGLYFWHASRTGEARKGKAGPVRAPTGTGETGPSRATVAHVSSGPIMVRSRLPMISRFAAAALVSVALGAVAEAAVWGLRAALPAVTVACAVTLSSRLLREDWPSASWPVIVGYGALGIALVIGTICLTWHISVDYDNAAVHVVGAVAVAVPCCAGLLAAADFRRDRSDRSSAPSARGRAG